MHLAVGLTTTSTKKRKEKLTKFQQEELERNWRDRNQWLKKENLPKETYEQFLEWVYGKGKKERKVHEKSRPTYAPPQSQTINSKVQKNNETDKRDWNNIKSHVDRPSSEACTKKPSPTYTGQKVLGIAVLHKSCLQPVFSQEEAIEVAKMRR